MEVTEMDGDAVRQAGPLPAFAEEVEEVPPCAVCDRCWSSGEKYVCRGLETFYDPVQGVERQVELPCAVARGTSFCGFTQEWLCRWYRRRNAIDRVRVGLSLLAPLCLVAACIALGAFIMADLQTDQQSSDFIVSVFVGIGVACVFLGCLGWLGYELSKAVRWRFHTPSMYQAKRSLKRAEEFERQKGGR